MGPPPQSQATAGARQTPDRLIPTIGQAGRLGRRFDRWDRLRNRDVRILRFRADRVWKCVGVDLPIRPRPVRFPPSDHSPNWDVGKTNSSGGRSPGAPRPLHHRFHSFHICSSPLRHRRDWEETSIAPVNSPNYAARVLVGRTGTTQGMISLSFIAIDTASSRRAPGQSQARHH